MGLDWHLDWGSTRQGKGLEWSWKEVEGQQGIHMALSRIRIGFQAWS